MKRHLSAALALLIAGFALAGCIVERGPYWGPRYHYWHGPYYHYYR